MEHQFPKGRVEPRVEPTLSTIKQGHRPENDRVGVVKFGGKAGQIERFDSGHTNLLDY
jgi:hypothetical protein